MLRTLWLAISNCRTLSLPPFTSLTHSLSLSQENPSLSFSFSVYNFHKYASVRSWANAKAPTATSEIMTTQFGPSLFHHSLQLSFAVSKLCKRIFTLGWGESFSVVEDPTLGLSDARVKEIPIPTSKYEIVKIFCQKSRTEKSRLTCPKILSTKTNKSYSSPSLFHESPNHSYQNFIS